MNFTEIGEQIWEIRNPNGKPDGKRIAIVAALHGDEPAGLASFEYLKNTNLNLNSSIHSIVLITGNIEALKVGKRALQLDLNRVWNENENHDTNTIEYRRYLEMRPALFRPNTVMLDLHTASAAHMPFAILDAPPTEEMIAALSYLPIEYVTYNWREFIGKRTISGGLHGYDQDALAIGYESGQHASPDSKTNAIDAVKALIDFYNNDSIPEAKQSTDQKWLKVLQEVKMPEMHWEWHKEGTGPLKIEKGELIGYVEGTPYHSPIDGYIIMPNKKFSKANPDIGYIAVEEALV